MTKEEHQMCERAATLYQDKVRECRMLRNRLEQKERENRLLKEQLGYRRAADIQYSKADAEVLLIMRNRQIRY